jgi:hypothetical protein
LRPGSRKLELREAAQPEGVSIRTSPAFLTVIGSPAAGTSTEKRARSPRTQSPAVRGRVLEATTAGRRRTGRSTPDPRAELACTCRPRPAPHRRADAGQLPGSGWTCVAQRPRTRPGPLD